jgi:GNAT superfamily N-acetyltransferase
VKTRVIPIADIRSFMESNRQNMVAVILFSGDRYLCCDEAVVIEVDGNIVSIATISPEGEEGQGPEIIGIYTLKPFRKHGFGKEVLCAAISRCQERGFSKIKITTLSSGGKHIVDTVAQDLPDLITVIHLPPIIDMLDQQE